MTLYTNDDVQRGVSDLGLHRCADEWVVKAILDAVLPKYITRLADEIEAKRPCKCTSCSAIKNLIREKAGE